ncbi:MAG TPA: TadE family protein [Abditibacterium sp.]|jgi:Flp pilus assembly protein TadG
METSSNFGVRAFKCGPKRGQTMVETALVMTFILLPLTLGLIQFGLVLNASNTMTQIAREAGRYAAVHCQEATFDSTATVTLASGIAPAPPATGAQASLRYYLWTVTTPTGIRWDDIRNNIVVDPAPGSARTSGQPISVTITYPMTRKVFVGSLFLLTPALNKLKQPYVAESTFVIE